MDKVYHIHDVLDILYNASSPMTIDALMEAVDKQFGEQAVFTSCSETHFGKSGIIDFLQSRQKITVEGVEIRLLTRASCNH